MIDRRQDYRHWFEAARRLMVQFTPLNEQSSIIGEILNLSVGGMCVQADALANLTLEQLMATCVLEPGAAPVKAVVRRIYTGQANRSCAGFHFVPTSNYPVQEERERKIWQFLLTEQRRERQRRLEEARSGRK